MSKLWLLKPIDVGSKPWNPWYEVTTGLVVRSESGHRARALASEHAGAEGASAWTDHTLSTCVELLSEGDEAVILREFDAG
jgi:hypothetical protein